MTERRRPPLRRFSLVRFAPERREGERRESPRFPVTASVRFLRATDNGPELIEGDMLEASLTGMRVSLGRPVRKGEQLLVEVCTEWHGNFSITAQIMWVERDAEDWHIAGCEFCSILSLKQRAQLQRLAEEAMVEAT
jgi:PilZ domain-containing protein